jgi:hypothetical protein
MSLKVELDEGVTWYTEHGVVAWQPSPGVCVPLRDYGSPRTRRWTTRQLEEVGFLPPGTARRRRRAKP